MKRKLLCLLVANLFAASAPAFAQSGGVAATGSVSAGGIYTDDGSPRDASRLNEYQDLDSGALAGFDIRGRGERYWFDAFGENLGRDDQYVAMRGGTYDVFKYRLWTDSLKHNFLFNGVTPYAGAGSSTQTAAFPRLDPAVWNQVDMAYKRRDDGGLFEFQGTKPWYFRIEGNQVTWKGSKPGSSSQGTSPGNGFVELALPVEYKTRNLVVEGGYSTREMHFDLSWMLSKFENSQENVAWTNGYLGGGVDRTYLPADNRYTRVAGNASYRDLPWHTTVAARFTADELKDSVALGTTLLSGTAGQTSPTGPSATTFDGRVKNTTFSLSATSAPASGFDTRLYYNWRKRDDQSAEVTFTSSSLGTYEAERFSSDKDNWGFDAYWRFSRGNRLGAGFDYLDTEREGRHDFDRTKDKRFFVEYKNTMHNHVAGRLKYTRLERDSNFLLGSSGTSPTDAAYWNRYVTAFDLSNVNQDQWKLTLDFVPVRDLDVSFEGTIKKNRFDQNTLGRLADDRREVYVSASYRAGPVRFTVFGDNEQVEYESMHRIVGTGTAPGAYEPATAPTASNYNWNGKVTDKSWAAGVSVDWPATEKLTLKASAIYYKTDGFVDLSLQEGVPASVVRPAPISTWDDSRRTSFTIRGDYAISKRWSFTGGYAYEKYEYVDSQYEGYRYTIPASSNQNSYLNGTYAFQPYKANIWYGMVTYRF